MNWFWFQNYSNKFFSDSKELLKIAEENPSCHFFLDEVHVDDGEISSKTILEMSKSISKESYLWIASQSDTNTDKDDKNLLGMQFFSNLNQTGWGHSLRSMMMIY